MTLTTGEKSRAREHADKALEASTVEECYAEVRLYFATVRLKLAELERKEKAQERERGR